MLTVHEYHVNLYLLTLAVLRVHLVTSCTAVYVTFTLVSVKI